MNWMLHDCGLLDYDDGYKLQRQLHLDVCEDAKQAHIIACEHPPTITLGKNANPDFLQHDASFFQELGIHVHKIERGGEVTAHNPGQLVIYPILNVHHWRLSPKQYVDALEDAIIGTLKKFSISAQRVPGMPGVWVEDKKIAAIGIRIEKRVTLHGLALNVSNDLNIFSLFVPCGLVGRKVTSLAQISAKTPDFQAVKHVLLSTLQSAIMHRCR